MQKSFEIAPGTYLHKVGDTSCTEAFHILSPKSIGSDRLRELIIWDGLQVLSLDRAALDRSDFSAHRLRRGHRHVAVEILG
jgi:hypothetical protein